MFRVVGHKIKIKETRKYCVKDDKAPVAKRIGRCKCTQGYKCECNNK